MHELVERAKFSDLDDHSCSDGAVTTPREIIVLEIYVINLKRATDRWQNINRQMKSLGSAVTRFEAVDGREGHHPLFNRYDDRLRRRWKGNSLSVGQLGCFASHYLLWQKCMNEQRPFIILEDDAVVEPSLFQGFMDDVRSLDASFECIRLFRNHAKHHRAIDICEMGRLKIVKYTKGPMRGTGYYLTPAGAKKFLDCADTWFLPVDITMDRFWENRVECFGVQPPTVENDPTFESTIGYENKTQARKLRVRILREMFSLREQLFRAFANLRFAVRSFLFKHC